MTSFGGSMTKDNFSIYFKPADPYIAGEQGTREKDTSIITIDDIVGLDDVKDRDDFENLKGSYDKLVEIYEDLGIDPKVIETETRRKIREEIEEEEEERISKLKISRTYNELIEGWEKSRVSYYVKNQEYSENITSAGMSIRGYPVDFRNKRVVLEDVESVFGHIVEF